ncbi:glycosyltransferase [Microbacterium sp.]|uniref:glycosyltransferase n=1 Tax=Microbacterium sp. TaxID=51671 RepID=UPI002E32DC36|nr:glycosyltransferase [Microbacterium sp.]HEX5729139.1 glycosyltransferase [Microbacterium sp.]
MNTPRTTASSGITVSVVLPVKDDAPELRRCLSALASQTRPADEILVVDNASSDASARTARAAGARVERCDRPGIAAAAAHGYDCARGALILRLDADCVPDRLWVETVIDAFERRPDVDAFSGGAHFIDGPRPLRSLLAAAYLASYAAVAASALGHLPLFGSNMAFRREAWRHARARAHLDDPGLHDDLDLAFHLGERFRIRYLPGARMGMSMRPFASRSAFLRRIAAGFRTVLIHWPHDFPPIRWTRMALRRLRDRVTVIAASRPRG